MKKIVKFLQSNMWITWIGIITLLFVLLSFISIRPQLSNKINITIHYTGYGTEQDYATIQMNKGQIEKKIDNNSVEFSNVSVPEQGIIDIYFGNNGGTIELSGISIQYRDYTYEVFPEELQYLCSIENIETLKVDKEYYRFFTYDPSLSKAEFNIGTYLNAYSETQDSDDKVSILFICWLLALILIFERKIFKENEEKPKIERGFQLISSFLFAAVLYCLFTSRLGDMISQSGDATDIWSTITSFHSDNIYGSYVLYKGINAVYPYVWLYDLAQIFKTGDWFFVKGFYCLAFAYVSSVGFPNMIERLTGKRTKCFRRCLCAVVMWVLWEYSGAFSQLMIDLPCLLYYVLLINAVLKIYRGEKNIYRYVWIGLLSGVCMSASGQYTTPAVCILLFVILVTIKGKHSVKLFFQSILKYVVPLMLCTGIILFANNCFEVKVVDSLRQQGAWIPSGDDWLQAGLARFKIYYRTGGNASSIPSHRNEAIFLDEFGENVNQITSLTVGEYLGLFFKYPIDFILNYLNSFFLILSPDGGQFKFLPLFIFYSLMYISLYIGVNRCHTWKQFFSPLFLIGFSFLWATVPMIVMNIEERTCMQIQGLIIALAICDDTIWEIIRDVKSSIKNVITKKVSRVTWNIPYALIFYIIFIVICFMHVSALYETIGVDPQAILIKFN